MSREIIIVFWMLPGWHFGSYPLLHLPAKLIEPVTTDSSNIHEDGCANTWAKQFQGTWCSACVGTSAWRLNPNISFPREFSPGFYSYYHSFHTRIEIKISTTFCLGKIMAIFRHSSRLYVPSCLQELIKTMKRGSKTEILFVITWLLRRNNKQNGASWG